EFANIDADKLTLWKVSIPDDNNTDTVLANLVLENNDEKGDLRQTFPCFVDEFYIEKLSWMLALIWECDSPTLSTTTIPSDPYIELKKEPSVFKARLPCAFSGLDIDLCLPAYTDKDGTECENPLHDDPQFKETVNLLQNKIDEGKGQHVIVLAGVSGGGKTSATFAVATERWTIYLDCSHSVSFYGNLIYTELSSIRSFPPVLDNIPSQSKALNTLDLALLSRGLLLIRMLIQRKVSTPKDWLFVQLRAAHNGLPDIISKIREILLEQQLNLNRILILLRAIKACLGINALLLVCDEVQLLYRHDYGQYNGSSRAGSSWNLLQAYIHHTLGSFPFTLLLAGTSMHLARGLSLVTSVGKIGAIHRVQAILKLPFLTPNDVLRNLNNTINLQGVTDGTRNYLGIMLQGRPRGCAYFIKLLAERRSTQGSKEQEIRELIKIWHQRMCTDMAKYLRNTCELLGDKIDPYQAILDVPSGCFQFDLQAIALLQHGILPSKTPAYITLSTGMPSQEIEINTTLESFLLPSIELFLGQRGKTLVDTLVDNMSRLQHIKTIGNQLDSAFATAMIQKRGRNVREELSTWTNDKEFVFPDWITTKLRFVTTSNLANGVSLVEYIKDVFSNAPNYCCHAIQPGESAGSDIVFSLVDDEQHVVLMSVSCTISGKNVKREKIMEQALKANLKYQYMVTTKKRTKDDDVLSNSCKKPKLVMPIDEPTNIPVDEPTNQNVSDSTIADDDDLIIDKDENFDLNYVNTAKLFKVSENYAVLHNSLLSLITRNYIHVLVELPRRAKPHGTRKRPETYRFDTNGDLINHCGRP
ncbi:LOW QUALITY PROTEIN: hypothetical protein BC937DRAFT_88367, partial [Endogone sp. FLAS-F59071]